MSAQLLEFPVTWLIKHRLDRQRRNERRKHWNEKGNSIMPITTIEELRNETDSQ